MSWIQKIQPRQQASSSSSRSGNKIYMKMLSKCLSHITSSLYNCMLSWKAKLPFPLKNTSKRHRIGKCQPGLETLVHSKIKQPPRVLHRFEMEETIESKSSPLPPLSSSLSWLWSQSSPPFRTLTLMGDMIGTESGDCMITDDIEEVSTKPEAPKVRSREKSKTKREFPPPLSVLRETGEMALTTFKRKYNDDGRLIITAERVRYHENYDGECDYCEECGYLIGDEEEMEFNEGFEFFDQEEEEHGFEFEFEKEVSNDSGQQHENLSQCVTYDDIGLGLGPVGFLHHSDSFPNIYLGQPASAPLRPMTPVR